MVPPSFTETAQQHIVGRIEEQHLNIMAVATHRGQYLGQRAKELTAPQIDAQSDAHNVFLVALAKLDEFRNQRRR
jgi:hypothetical protein